MSSLPSQIYSALLFATTFLYASAFLFAAVGLVPALTLMLFRGAHKTIGLIWIACVFTLLFAIVGTRLSNVIRMDEFKKLAIRTKPLISAIKEFEKEEGRAPKELEELVPNYIHEIPSTGITAYPQFRYEKFKNDSEPWRLWLDCGVGYSNWDEFYYNPSETYEARPSGWVEPVDTWAYFHE